MKKIIVLLVIMFAAIGTVVAQQRKQPVKKTTVSAEEHLCFEGVPIDGSTESFINALAKKGIKGLTGQEGHQEIMYKGRNSSIRLEFDSNSRLYGVTLTDYVMPESSEKIDYYYDLVCRNIEKKYKYKKNYYNFYSDVLPGDHSLVYSIYSYKNTTKKIGDISVTMCWGNGNVCILLNYYDYSNNLKFNKDYYPYCNSEIAWKNYPFRSLGYTIKYGIEKNTGNIFVNQKIIKSGKQYKYILCGKDKHLFCNLMETCKDEIKRDYFINELFRETERIIEDTKITYIFSDILTDNVNRYYTRLELESEKKEKEKQRQRQQQLAQRRKSFGFMDLMHLLAPGFFTQDDVELWNKMSESDQKAIIQGSFGAYFGMGDTRGHTERMHTPSLRNQQ